MKVLALALRDQRPGEARLVRDLHLPRKAAATPCPDWLHFSELVAAAVSHHVNDYSRGGASCQPLLKIG